MRAHLTFRGQVRIAIEVKAPTPAIVLNSDALTLDKVLLDGKENGAAALDAKLQRATLTFAHPVATGRHTLAIDYHGVIGKATLGFFAMDYDSPAGQRRTIATNFEPASERRFMPSWDEPGFKATFSISVDVPANRMAVANMPIASTEALAEWAEARSLCHHAEDVDLSAVPRHGRFRADSTESGWHRSRSGGQSRRYGKRAAMRFERPPGCCITTTTISEFVILCPSSTWWCARRHSGRLHGELGRHLLFAERTCYSIRQLSTEADRQLVFLVVLTKWRISGSAISSPWPGGTTSG